MPADVPLSVGVIEPQVLPSQLNTVEFHWDPTKRTSLFLQVSLEVRWEWQQLRWERKVSLGVKEHK